MIVVKYQTYVIILAFFTFCSAVGTVTDHSKIKSARMQKIMKGLMLDIFAITVGKV